MTQIEEILAFFAESSGPILFCGAGTSARAGLPVWGSYLQMLAELIRADNALVASLISEKLREAAFLDAAQAYFLANAREGDLLNNLKIPLQGGDPSRLESLMQLPVKAVVTTNYDRQLHHAYASNFGKAPIQFESDIGKLTGANFEADYYIARIHGSEERPESMLMTKAQYQQLNGRNDYEDFLKHIYTDRQILFVGFSFYDPAIRMVLEAINKSMGPRTNGRHIALLPADIDPEFPAKLRRLNIKPITYNPFNHHAELWDIIAQVSVKLATGRGGSSPAPPRDPLESVKKFLAMSYARLRMGPDILPLRIAVLEGVVAQLVQSAGATGVTQEELKNELLKHLRLNSHQAKELVSSALALLTRENICKRLKTQPPKYVSNATASGDLTFDEAIRSLTDSTVTRLFVRHRISATSDIKNAIIRFFERAALQRGWDLGAAFASGVQADPIDVSRVLAASSQLLASKTEEQIAETLVDLFQRPTDDEAAILADLGRASFALELAIQAPKDTFFHKETLPQQIYLDANMLMPAIVEGHPHHQIYQETFSKLRDGVERSEGHSAIYVLSGYLNEVISHRRLARSEYEARGEGANEDLRRQALLLRTDNMNVFLGAYANHLNQEKPLPFPEFLAKYAPWETEHVLENWLHSKNIRVANVEEAARSNRNFGVIYHGLEVAYANALAYLRKSPEQITHDALQIAFLQLQRQTGARVLFVSADKRLRLAVASGRFPELASTFISHIALTQLVDLLLGTVKGSRSVTRLIWNARCSSGSQAVITYLTNRALSTYNEVTISEMNSIIESISEAATREATRLGIDLGDPRAIGEPAARSLMDRFESDFYLKMEEILRKPKGR
jgi:predicted nucleic acid-binding protein